MNVYKVGPDLGDAIASLAVIKYLGRGHIRLYDTPGTKGFSEASYNAIKPLIESQNYCASLARHNDAEELKYSHDFSGFREKWGCEQTILAMQARWVGIHPALVSLRPWISVGEVISHRRIVVCRSCRNKGNFFAWPLWWHLKWRESSFIGVRDDYDTFCRENIPYGPGGYRKNRAETIPFHETRDLLEAARFISGGRMLLCNQTSILWLGHALGFSPMLVEKTSDDSTLFREGVQYIENPEDNWSLQDIMKA